MRLNKETTDFLLASISIAILGLICTIWAIVLPADSRNTLALGYSANRIALILAILVPSSTAAYAGYSFYSLAPRKAQALRGRLKTFVDRPAVFVTLAIGLSLTLLVTLTLSGNLSGFSQEFAARLLPLLVFLGGAAAILLFELTLLTRKHEAAARLLRHLDAKSLSLLALIIAFAFIQFPVTFFQSGGRHRPDPVPFSDDVGFDLAWEMRSSRVFLEQGYIGQDIPFNLFLFAPLLSMDFNTAYKILTLMTFVSFLFLTFWAPRLFSRSAELVPIIAMFGIAGLFSYGLQFEMEQGQYNLIAFTCSVLGGYLFHTRPRLRLAAYILFSIGFQMKLWPGIFILLLVDNWQDIKGIFLRFSALLMANIALFFVLGVKFLHFFTYISDIRFDHFGAWTHSIEGGLYFLGDLYPWIQHNEGILTLLLFTLLGSCLMALVVRAYIQNKSGVDFHLLFVCVIAAMLVPTLSNDYKLPILLPPTILVLANTKLPKNPNLRGWMLFGLFIVALGTAFTLFTFVIKPDMLRNNMPIFVIQMLAVVMLAFAQPQDRRSSRRLKKTA